MTGAFSQAFVMVFLMSVCAVTAFVAAYWIMSGWFDRRIRGTEAAALLSGLLVLMCVTVSMVARGGPGAPIMIVAVAGFALLGRALVRRADRRLADAIDREDIAKYQDGLAADPKNVAAHSLLADTYRRLEDYARAIEEYEAAIRLDPSLKEERVWLERSRAELERRQRKDLRCPRCGFPRPARAPACPECGRLYSSVETWAHAFRVMTPMRKAGWVGLGIGASGVAVVAALLAPEVAKLVGLAVVVLAPVMLIIISLRARRSTG